MKQYLELLQHIKSHGVHKSEARSNMPGTTSVFGYQFRHNLADGFPLLTTKHIPFKGVVAELLWFLSGSTNIKFLDNHGIRYMWHEDAFNYYQKICDRQNLPMVVRATFDEFKNYIATNVTCTTLRNYNYGDTGKQYPWLWRSWGESPNIFTDDGDFVEAGKEGIDQIKNLINGLLNSPMSRRHIITAWNPSTLNDMALHACHAFVQFNCRPLTLFERNRLLSEAPNWVNVPFHMIDEDPSDDILSCIEEENIPKYYLDCQMYQRSADVFLGVPFNIASYALLTEILAEILNMVPGEYIHTFGDVHIYDNHKEQVDLQLSREPHDLPKLRIKPEFWNPENSVIELYTILDNLEVDDFGLIGYNPYPSIKGKLSTGLK